jgi:hypothetical protein
VVQTKIFVVACSRKALVDHTESPVAVRKTLKDIGLKRQPKVQKKIKLGLSSIHNFHTSNHHHSRRNWSHQIIQNDVVEHISWLGQETNPHPRCHHREQPYRAHRSEGHLPSVIDTLQQAILCGAELRPDLPRKFAHQTFARQSIAQESPAKPSIPRREQTLFCTGFRAPPRRVT